jgi:uncharacterized protein YjbI with pentapeptide repeats
MGIIKIYSLHSGAIISEHECENNTIRKTVEAAIARGIHLSEADLSGADLRGADLRKADLRWANLRDADLRGANLNFSSWPLWCGSFDVKVDIQIVSQLAYHFCRLCCDDSKYAEARAALIDIANQFDLICENEVPELKEDCCAKDSV